MTTNSRLSTTRPEKQNQKQTKQKLEQEQIYKNGDHMEGYQQGEGVVRMGEKVQRIRSINGWYKIDRGRLA